MDTSTALHQLEAMSSDLYSLHTDALGLDATAVAHKAWQAREAVAQAKRALGELADACTAWEASEVAPGAQVHSAIFDALS